MKAFFLFCVLVMSSAQASEREAICNLIEKGNVMFTNSSCSDYVEVEKDVFAANTNYCLMVITAHQLKGKTKEISKEIETYKNNQLPICAVGSFLKKSFIVEKLVLPAKLDIL